MCAVKYEKGGMNTRRGLFAPQLNKGKERDPKFHHHQFPSSSLNDGGAVLLRLCLLEGQSPFSRREDRINTVHMMYGSALPTSLENNSSI